MKYHRLWERLVEYINEWVSAREVPDRIEVTFGQSPGVPDGAGYLVYDTYDWEPSATRGLPEDDFNATAAVQVERVVGVRQVDRSGPNAGLRRRALPGYGTVCRVGSLTKWGSHGMEPTACALDVDVSTYGPAPQQTVGCGDA